MEISSKAEKLFLDEPGKNILSATAKSWQLVGVQGGVDNEIHRSRPANNGRFAEGLCPMSSRPLCVWGRPTDPEAGCV